MPTMAKVKSESRSSSSHKSKKKFSHSRSRSRSRSDRNRRRRSSNFRTRSRSRSYVRSKRRDSLDSSSLMSKRRHHYGTRDNPQPNKCLGVFGLKISTDERRILHIFNKYGIVDSIDLIIDPRSQKSRGFCFVYFRNIENATWARDQCNGMDIDGRKVRVDYSTTMRAHTPTPGIYMGTPYTSNLRS